MGTAGFKKRLDRFLWDGKERGLHGELMRLALVCGWKFGRDKGPLRASALAFSTSLGLVPLLAFAFALLKGLGAEAGLVNTVGDFISGGNPQIAAKLTEYVGRIKVSTLGVAGLASLAFSTLMVMNNVEHCFNDIWGVAKGRSFVRKITDYTAILILCPLLLLFSTSMATTAQISKYLKELDFVEKALPLLFSLAPFAAKALAFGAAYLVVPNHKVGWRSAAAGGLTAAVFWHFAELGYIRFGIVMAKSNAVYGALAHLPAFLLWVYIGWVIVIIGAELSCILELPGRGRFLKGGRDHWTPRPGAALALLVEIAERHTVGERADEEDLIARAGLHPVEGRRIVGELVRVGLVVRKGDDESVLLPGRNPDHTPMSSVISGFSAAKAEKGAEEPIELAYLKDIETNFGSVTWGEWARRAKTGAKGSGE